MEERSRQRLRTFAVVCSAIAVADALTLLFLGDRSYFTWVLLGGSTNSLHFNLRARAKRSRVAG